MTNSHSPNHQDVVAALMREFGKDPEAAANEIARYISEVETQSWIDELEQLKEYMTLYPVDPDWQYAVPEQQIDVAIEQLKAQAEVNHEES